MTIYSPPSPEELVEFLDGDENVTARSDEKVWKILVIDDDVGVHQATRFALNGVDICGRALTLLHAHSTAEATTLLQQHPDVAVALLDVVMDSPDAGLKMVHTIRHDLAMSNVRIVLRTGQPGYAPELSIIREYDINDYRTKAELTHTRLITSLTAAIRSYQQLCSLQAGQRGMEFLIQSGNELFVPRDVRSFAEATLSHLSCLLDEPVSAVFIGPPTWCGVPGDQEELSVLATSAKFGSVAGQTFSEMAQWPPGRVAKQARALRSNIFDANYCCLYLGRSHGKEALLLVELAEPLDDTLRRVLEVLSINLRVGFENVVLFERLNFFAYFDTLTRLPNRTRFLDELDQRLTRGGVSEWKMGIIDIVRFSELNDALGHRTGDLLLVEVTQRLRAFVGKDALVSRVAGDAFAVCWRPGAQGVGAILNVFAAPFVVRSHSIPMRARAGFVEVASIPGGAVELLKRANLALSHAKQEGDQHWRFFASEMEANTQNRVLLLNELRSALHLHKGLELYYQPQVSHFERQLVGCEALIRWRKPHGEMVAPDVFIPLAEYTGLIVEIGDWVFVEACRQIVRWDKEGLPPFRVGINISAAQFREANFVEKIATTISSTGVDPLRLELEITESVAMEDPDSVARQLRELKALGLRVAVDDFGCGFSSLGSLNRLPFDKVKIDRAFIRELTPETCKDSIATMIVKLARSLSLDVIAEGVETESQASLLEAIGCKEMQGYLYGKPMNAKTLAAWVRSRYEENDPENL